VSTATKIGRFFRTPKGLLILILILFVFLAGFREGVRPVLVAVAGAVVAASLVDVVLFAFLRRAWQFPSGAILTGLFVAMVLDARIAWYVPACTSAIAIVSKYVFRYGSANVFNPAAVGLVAAFHIFGTAQNWWGALPATAPFTWLILFASGLYIVKRVNKIPLVLVFLGCYFLLFTIAAFTGDAARLGEVFRTPDAEAALFFAFFILSDPPTSPTIHVDQAVCGIIVAIASYAAFQLLGLAYYLLAGVLVGNLWEAWRRWYSAARRTQVTAADGASGA
jgi:Na+-translocating ferredoxin:NAD+ oxidoreductase RnfD subunit